MTSRFQDLHVLVTGATGIAAAAARRLAGEGAAVFVASIDSDECRSLVEDLEAAGGVADWRAADLRDESAVMEAFGAFRRRFGRLDGVLAVVGGSGRRFGDGPAHDVSLAAWEATLALNLDTAFLTGREAVRAMLEQDPESPGGRGSVVFVGSALGRHPAPERFATHAYAAAKGAIESLTRSMAARYASDGIRVNAVAPALVDTPMARRAVGDPETVAYVEHRQPLTGGVLTPEDVAAAAAYLLSADARAVTGQVLAVDGGWSVIA
jgi:NAD(P)-dependent dehydrogenase (short-subunit alcohol dehydrogenase family)